MSYEEIGNLYTIDFNDWKEISFRDSLITIGGVPAEILDSNDKMYIFLQENEIKVKPNLSKGKLWEELFDNFVEVSISLIALVNFYFNSSLLTSISFIL